MQGDSRDLSDYRYELLGRVDSTNAEALRRAQNGERGPLWILSDTQTAGRGRLGRSWSSIPGNIHQSLLWSPNCMLGDLPIASLAVGIGVFDGLHAIAGEGLERGRLRLKWPNDVLIDGAKVGGILIESTVISGQLIAVAGVGVNVAHTPTIGGQPVTSLASLCGPPDLDAVRHSLMARIGSALALWHDGRGAQRVIDAWLERAGPVSEEIGVTTENETVFGRFAGLNENGNLVLIDDNETKRVFSFGEVSLRIGGRRDGEGA